MAAPRSPAPSSLAKFGSLIGDPVRASILRHLSDGSRRPASELAQLAGASPQSASAHLARLTDGGLLAVDRQGRHRFYCLASGEVAEAIESLVNFIEQPMRKPRHDERMRQARLCYDHLAGRLGVGIFEFMTGEGLLALNPEGPQLTDAGHEWCRRQSIDPAVPAGSRRPQFRLCLDWTERRHHLGGCFGAVIAKRMLDSGHVLRRSGERTLELTSRGKRFLRDAFALDLMSGAG